MATSNREEMARMAAMIRAFVIAGAVQLAVSIVEITETGAAGAPAAAKDTGELRASPRLTINQPSAETSERGGSYTNPSAAELRRAVQLGGLNLGDTIWLTWIARHANIIEGGRRRDRRGRMIGSPQNPDGFLWRARDVGVSRMDAWRYGATTA